MVVIEEEQQEAQTQGQIVRISYLRLETGKNLINFCNFDDIGNRNKTTPNLQID